MAEETKKDHECYQLPQFELLMKSDKKQNEAIFGDVMTGEPGMVAEIKAIRALLEEMKPTYKELNDWGTFFQKGKKAGLTLAAFITVLGVIFGGVLALKDWLKH